MNFEGKTVIGYGVGFYYEAVKDKAREIMRIDYLCDAKWDDSDIEFYDNIPVIKRKDLEKVQNKVLVIFSCINALVKTIIDEFTSKGYECCSAMELMGVREITGSQIKAEGKDGVLKVGTNTIHYDETLPDNVWLYFMGFDSVVKIGKNLSIDHLSLIIGSNGKLEIGDNVRILNLTVDVAGAKMTIGDDCLFAYDIEMRTHDSHPIFDKTSGKRLNHPKDVMIGNHVWVSAGARLFAGAKIGNGSIVGANALTSSEFGEHLIIAGSPAKVIRENIVWSKDNTALCDWDSFEECASKEAQKYL